MSAHPSSSKSSLIMALGTMFLAALITTFGIACTPITRRPSLGAALTIIDRSKLEEGLQVRAEEVRSFRALYRLEIEDHQQKSLIRSAVAWESPDNFRFELLPLTAAYTLQLLVKSRSGVVFIDQSSKTAATSSQSLLRNTLKLPILEEDLASYLLGRIPERLRVLTEGEFSTHASPSDPSAVLIVSPRTRDWFSVERSSNLLRRAELYNRFDRNVDFILEILAYQSVGEISIPSSLRLSLPKESQTLHFTRLSSKLNEPISAQLFEVVIPAGYEVSSR